MSTATQGHTQQLPQNSPRFGPLGGGALEPKLRTRFPVLKPLRPRKVRKSSPGSLSEKQVQCQKLRVQKTEAGNCTNVTLKACWKLGVQQQSVRCTSQGVCKQLSRST